MSSTYNPGRVAGFLYLLLGFSVFRPVYVAGRLILREDASATTNNIKVHELVFRIGYRQRCARRNTVSPIQRSASQDCLNLITSIEFQGSPPGLSLGKGRSSFGS